MSLGTSVGVNRTAILMFSSLGALVPGMLGRRQVILFT